MAEGALIYVLLCLLVPLHSVETSKILFYTGRGEGSHYTSAAFLAEELASRGHEVMFLLGNAYRYRSAHPVHSKLFDFKFIDAGDDEEYELFLGLWSKFGLEGRNLIFLREIVTRWAHCEVRYCRKVLEEKVLKGLKAENYDLMVIEPMLWPCSIILSKYLNVKTVALMQTSVNAAELRLTGHAVSSATLPELGTGFPTDMNFWQRVLNCVVAFYYGTFMPDRIYKDYFQQFGMSHLAEIMPQVNLVVSNSDPLVDKVFPVYPGHVRAGGLTTRPAGPLDQDYEEFMQSSGEHGVIIVTLGSYAVGLPDRLLDAYRDAFAGLPQKVIWQLKDGSLSDVPGNVRTSEWIPQNDLLGHEKTMLLIYQGGNNGLYEAVYHRVPVIAMPIFQDHHDTAQNIVEKGIGLRIRISELTGEFVRQQIVEVLTNETYKKNMDHISTMFRDRPQTPQEKAAYWVEHILKYGSDHLHRPGSDMSFIQFYQIDVVGFLAFCVALTIFIIYMLLKYTIHLSSMMASGEFWLDLENDSL